MKTNCHTNRKENYLGQILPQGSEDYGMVAGSSKESLSEMERIQLHRFSLTEHAKVPYTRNSERLEFDAAFNPLERHELWAVCESKSMSGGSVIGSVDPRTFNGQVFQQRKVLAGR